jgi:hypothetical protein
MSFLLAASLLMSPVAGAAGKDSSQGTLLFLHYRWIRDSLTLVESKRIPAKVKPSRLAAKLAGEAPGSGPRSGFSYDLLGADGGKLATRFLAEPGLRRVEFQEKGDPTLRSQEQRVDTTDIFLRIPEAEAKRIRFHRHAPAEPQGLSMSGAAIQGPEAPQAKKQIAEFGLE